MSGPDQGEFRAVAKVVVVGSGVTAKAHQKERGPPRSARRSAHG
jgi:hypothetical protein